SADSHQPNPAEAASAGQLGVKTFRGLIVARLNSHTTLAVAREPFPLVRERGGDIGRGRVIETDEEWKGKLIGEEEGRRIRDFAERGGAHSESVHEVELQRAARAQPATRQVG